MILNKYIAVLRICTRYDVNLEKKAVANAGTRNAIFKIGLKRYLFNSV